MEGRFRTSSLLIFAISALTLAVAVACLVDSLSWIDRPFPGFLIYKSPRVASMGSTDWSGVRAGIRIIDRIVSADGKPVREGKEVSDLAKRLPPGTPIQYDVESKGQMRKVTVPTGRFDLTDFIVVYFIIFLGGLAVFSIGFVVYILKPNVPSSWVFYFFCLVVSIYMFTGFDAMSSYHFLFIHRVVNPLLGATLFHLGLVFPERKRILNRFPALEYLSYVPAAVLVFFYELQLATGSETSLSQLFSWIPQFKTITAFTRIFTVAYVIGFIILVVYSMYRASSNVMKQRARMIVFGVTLAFFPTVSVMLILHFLKVNFPLNFMVVFVISFPASTAYSIIRHNLFEADTIIRRTVGYSIVTAVVIGAYIIVSVLLNMLLGQYQISGSRTFPIIFTLIIILVFNPLRNRIQTVVDRLFFRKEYDYARIIDHIGGAITSLLDLGQVLQQLVGTFVKDMFIDTSSVMLLNLATNDYRVYLADGERRAELRHLAFKRDQPLIRVIEKEKKELTKYDVLEDQRYRGVCEDCSRDFETLHASLIVPLVFHDQVIGLLNLGEKKSGKFYNREDVDLLRTVAKQGAVAIENARLADQMKAEEAVRANLARYLSPQIVEQVIQKNVQVNLGGARKVVTVLFSDIRNFTRISESLPPDRLVQILNEYFTEMARVIFENQGSLDKYIGDAIVAVFGSLIPLEHPSRNAVQGAIAMMKQMAVLNEKWKKEFGFSMEMGVGINTGEVFLGNVGSPERMEFTVIGDTVNIASRFSGVAQGGQILVTKETLEGLGSEIACRELPAVEVKGKTVKLQVFEILHSQDPRQTHAGK